MQIDLRDSSVDIAALVMHFMPDPLRGVSEMVRVVRAKGLVAAYTPALEAGGFPYEAVHRAMQATGLQVPQPPQPEAGNADKLLRLWQAAGLQDVSQREISVTRMFRDFEQYWQTATLSPRIAAVILDLAPDQVASVQSKTRGRVPVPPIVRAHAMPLSDEPVPEHERPLRARSCHWPLSAWRQKLTLKASQILAWLDLLLGGRPRR